MRDRLAVEREPERRHARLRAAAHDDVVEREMRAFADTVRKRLAEQAERQARMNGASNDAPAKANTKPG